VLLVALLPGWMGRPAPLPGPDAGGGVAVTPPTPPVPEVAGQPRIAAAPSGPEIRIERTWCTPGENKIVAVGDAPPVLQQSRQVVRDVRVVDERRHTRIEWTIASDETAVVPLEVN
jgi:hypothetical protein